jgi:hypothetical protein
MMALSIMKTKVEAKIYSGGLDEFSADLELIVQNCGTFYSKASYLYTVWSFFFDQFVEGDVL